MHDKGGTSGNGNSLEFSQDSLKFGEFELVPSGQNATVARGANSEVGIGVRNQFQALESDVREGDVVGLEEVDVGVPEAVALVGQSKGLTEQGENWLFQRWSRIAWKRLRKEILAQASRDREFFACDL